MSRPTPGNVILWGTFKSEIHSASLLLGKMSQPQKEETSGSLCQAVKCSWPVVSVRADAGLAAAAAMSISSATSMELQKLQHPASSCSVCWPRAAFQTLAMEGGNRNPTLDLKNSSTSLSRPQRRPPQIHSGRRPQRLFTISAQFLLGGLS